LGFAAAFGGGAALTAWRGALFAAGFALAGGVFFLAADGLLAADFLATGFFALVGFAVGFFAGMENSVVLSGVSRQL
jgi:hypothetical protein